MTVETLHDALNLLPGDLITAADKVRSKAGKPVIHWRRWTALAACLVLVLSFTVLWNAGWLPGIRSGIKETATEAPMAALESAAPEAAPIMPESVMEEVPAPEAAPQENADITEAPAHRHSFAEDRKSATGAIGGYCGNTLTTVHIDGSSYDLYGSDSIALTDILDNLPYLEETCRCIAEFTVDTELLTGIEINLTQGFARCEKGQADLTQEQAEIIQAIINRLN